MNDTSPEMEAHRLQLIRAMPLEERAKRILDLMTTARRFMIAGILAKHPGASDGEIRLKLAERVLEPELVEKYFSPAPRDDD
jgi:hypothetical protein